MLHDICSTSNLVHSPLKKWTTIEDSKIIAIEYGLLLVGIQKNTGAKFSREF